MSRRVLIWLHAAIALLLAACTSSNTSATVQSNAGYDTQYREPSRSSQNLGQGQQPGEEAKDQPVTIMYLSMETGDVYPGNDYYVYAVVDDPKKRDKDYTWSVVNGTIGEVPESERGRLQTLVEQGYNEAGKQAQPAAPAEGATGAPATGEGTAGPAAPATGAPATGAPAAGTPATGAPPTGTAGPAATGTPPPATGTPSNVPVDIQNLLDKQKAGTPLSAEEQATLEDWLNSPAGGMYQRMNKPASSMQITSAVYERRLVGGPDEKAEEAPVDEPAADEDTEGTQDPAEAGAERVEPSGAANVGEEPIAGREGKDAEGGKEAAVTGSENMRGEYKAWKDETTEPRKRGLGGYGEDEGEDGELTSEESFAQSTLVTDEPFIVWTPDKPGKVDIYMKVTWKKDDLTEPTKLPVTVRLQDPEVKIATDFPDIVREDDPVFVKLDGTNIPAFNKGLFTITFDPDKLSFREAQLGEFFDDAPNSTIYYAEPDKTAGKVLIAIDTNSELSTLSGDGPLVYLKFKAKVDVASQEETKLTLVGDTSASYILDLEGDNILPVPAEHPVFRTDLVMPPALPEAGRLNTPGGATGTPGQAPAAGTGTGGTALGPGGTGTGTGGTGLLPGGGGGAIIPGTGTGKTVTPPPGTGGTGTGGTGTGGTGTGGTGTGGTGTGGTGTGGTGNVSPTPPPGPGNRPPASVDETSKNGSSSSTSGNVGPLPPAKNVGPEPPAKSSSSVKQPKKKSTKTTST